MNTTNVCAKAWNWGLLTLVAVMLVVAAVLLWPRPGPASANHLTGAAAIAAGIHTCALTTEGGVKCWGYNGEGQLGDGTTMNRTTSVDVVGLGSGMAAIAAGLHHTCALTSGGGATCWGYNFYGQLGNGAGGGLDPNPTPVDVCASGATPPCTATNNNVLTGVAIAAGGFHTCALTSGGGVKCWGWNGEGQLGDGTNTDRTTPVDVLGLGSGVAAIAAGREHTCALTSVGGVKCWGWNGLGLLGDGTTTDRTTPVDVVGLGSGVAAIAPAGYHTCALTTEGGVKCWGSNGAGQLGDGTTMIRTTPVDVVGLGSGVAAIAAGGHHSCALTRDGGVKCWGSNGDGQLGDGTTARRTAPVDVAELGSGVAAIAAGFSHTCALTGGGGVKCWGDNDSGALGDGTTTQRTTPVDVAGLKPTACGDVNDSGSVDSIDVALVLQLTAGLVGSLENEASADVNGDGTINTIDAALILQLGAGLVTTLNC